MITLNAPAKINLFLDILDKRSDGFHYLTTCFQAIDLTDELVVEKNGDGEDTLSITGPFSGECPAAENNLVLHAVRAFRLRVPHLPYLAIRVAKNIPAQAGLGGGSSDAASILNAANEMTGGGLSSEELPSVALEIGSDCPFFLRGGTQMGEGRGEKLRPVQRRTEFALLLAVPHRGISTAEAFASLGEQEKGAKTNSGEIEKWLWEGGAMPALYNAFQRFAVSREPAIGGVLRELRQLGAVQTLLSGSGSACYGIFSTREEAEAAERNWRHPVRLLRVCEPI